MYGDEEGDGAKKDHWRLDPVHPSPAGYDNLMAEILKCHNKVSFNRTYTPGTAGGSGGGKIRRQAWV
jgi:hypothetical protein